MKNLNLNLKEVWHEENNVVIGKLARNNNLVTFVRNGNRASNISVFHAMQNDKNFKAGLCPMVRAAHNFRRKVKAQ